MNFVFYYCNVELDMAGAPAVLNKPRNLDLAQLILNTEANLGSQIAKKATKVKDLLPNSK